MIQLQYTCVAAPSLKELSFIIDHERDISYRTFQKAVGNDRIIELETLLGYRDPDNGRKRYTDLSLKSDYAVSYHKSKLPSGKPVYFCRHSCIEYIYY